MLLRPEAYGLDPNQMVTFSLKPSDPTDLKPSLKEFPVRRPKFLHSRYRIQTTDIIGFHASDVYPWDRIVEGGR